MRALHLLLSSVLFAFAVSLAPFTATDLHKLIRVGNPVVSSTDVVFTIREWNATTGAHRTSLQIMCVACTNNKISEALTPAVWGVTHSNPVFSPDGNTVFYFSNENQTAGTQVYTVDVATKKSTQLTYLPDIGYSNLMFSPNGKYILFSAEVYQSCSTLQCTKDLNDQVAARGSNSYREFTQLYARHWDTWETQGVLQHLFLQPVSQSNHIWSCVGSPIDLMPSLVANAPVKPFGGTEQFAISPDGLTVAFTAERVAHDTAWRTDWKVFVVQLSTGLVPSSPLCLTDDTDARAQEPTFSADGAFLFYLQMSKAQSESDRLQIVEYNRATGAKRFVAPSWDRSVDGGALVAEPSGRKLLATANDDGRLRLFSVDIASGVVTTLLFDHASSGFVCVPASELVYFAQSAITAPNDVWRLNFSPGANAVSNVTQMTAINARALSAFELVMPTPFYFAGADDDQVMAWVMKPAGFDATKRYPLAHLIHGGPESAWVDSWSTRWNPLLWAAQGYVVLMVNPRGSVGFGQAWTDAVQGDWGGKPFVDLMLGVDAALGTFQFADPDRLVACGASYGGFMINWINGHTTRYKALVNHDGLFDTIAMYFSSDEVFFTEAEFQGTPWTNPSGYDKFNPRAFVQLWQTPTLVVHGGKDFRIPESEGLSTFTALQRRGIASKLVYFEMESHWVLKEENSIEWYNQVLGWIGNYTK